MWTRENRDHYDRSDLRYASDGGYQGAEFQSTLKLILSQLEVEIVKRSDLATGFVVLGGRAHACLARPMPPAGQGLGEPQLQGASYLLLAAIRLMVRRPCRSRRSFWTDSKQLRNVTSHG
jgi:hypothetical protein